MPTSDCRIGEQNSLSSSSSPSPLTSSSARSLLNHHYNPDIPSSFASATTAPILSRSNSVGHLIENVTSGFLSSFVALETKAGSGRCPWIFKIASPHQKMNITLHQFSAAPSTSFTRDGKAVFLATLAESKMASNTTFRKIKNSVGGENDVINIISGLSFNYLTGPDTAELKVIFARHQPEVPEVGTDNLESFDRQHHHHHHHHYPHNRQQLPQRQMASFLIEFKVIGCLPLVTPVNAWAYSDGHVTTVTCNDTGEYFRLTCVGTEWKGQLANCTSPLSAPRPANVVDWTNDVSLKHGLLLVVALGVLIGIATGVLMLMIVLAYMKRRKLRRVRSRSSYALTANRGYDRPSDCSINDHHDYHHHFHSDRDDQDGHHYNHDHHHHQHHGNDSEVGYEDGHYGAFKSAELAFDFVDAGRDDSNALDDVFAATSDYSERPNWVWSTWTRRPEPQSSLTAAAGKTVYSQSDTDKNDHTCNGSGSGGERKKEGKIKKRKKSFQLLSSLSIYSRQKEATATSLNEGDVITSAIAATSATSPASRVAVDVPVVTVSSCVTPVENIKDDMNCGQNSCNNNLNDAADEAGGCGSENLRRVTAGLCYSTSMRKKRQAASSSENQHKQRTDNDIERCYRSFTKSKNLRSKDSGPYYFKLDTNSGLAGVRRTPVPSQSSPRNAVTSPEYTKVSTSANNRLTLSVDPCEGEGMPVNNKQTSNMLMQHIQHPCPLHCQSDGETQQLPQQNPPPLSSFKTSRRRNGSDGNIVDKPTQQSAIDDSASRDSIYGRCFSADAPYDFRVIQSIGQSPIASASFGDSLLSPASEAVGNARRLHCQYHSNRQCHNHIPHHQHSCAYHQNHRRSHHITHEEPFHHHRHHNHPRNHHLLLPQISSVASEDNRVAGHSLPQDQQNQHQHHSNHFQRRHFTAENVQSNNNNTNNNNNNIEPDLLTRTSLPLKCLTSHNCPTCFREISNMASAAAIL